MFYINLHSSRFIFRRPLLSTVSNIFTLPFQRNVWIAIGMFLVLVFCLLSLSVKWEYQNKEITKSTIYWKESNPTKPTTSDNLLILLSAFVQQGKTVIFDNIIVKFYLRILLKNNKSYISNKLNLISLSYSNNFIKTIIILQKIIRMKFYFYINIKFMELFFKYFYRIYI